MANLAPPPFHLPDLKDIFVSSHRLQQPGGFIIIVVDHMDKRHTHQDSLTAHLYLLLRKNTQPGDPIIRLAPDCWLICLDGCDAHRLKSAQYSLQSLFNRRCNQISSIFEGVLIEVTGAFMPPATARQMRENFDQLIQEAKNRLRRFKMIHSTLLKPPALPISPPLNQAMLPYEGIMGNRLFLAFQPVVDNKAGKLMYYECLARLLDSQGHILGADRFIPACEQNGLISLLDHKVQQLALMELSGNRHLRLAINVSAITAAKPVWLNSLKAQIKARPDLKGRLIIELTETSFFFDVNDSLHFISQLRDLGCHVSIDDFGAGYMSLTHLKPDLVQSVKLDAQFAKGLKGPSPSLHFIRAILALTHPQGIKCVAEGVEDEAAKNILIQENVDYLQGYHIARPSHFRKWV